MDYEKIKRELQEITKVASSVPEPFRERCFELLLQSFLREQSVGISESATGAGAPPPSQKTPTPPQIRVFMERTGITTEELDSILLYQDGRIHFIREPSPRKAAQGQMEWAMLLALKNGILSDDLSADPEDVRSICQEKDCYNRSNFAANFKVAKNARLFKNPLAPHGKPEQLSRDGETALAELIRSLAGASPT